MNERKYYTIDQHGNEVRPMSDEEVAHYHFYKQQLLDEEWYNAIGGDIS